MKKSLLIFTLVIALFLCACGSKESGGSKEKTVPAMKTIGEEAAAKREAPEEPILLNAEMLDDETGIEEGMYSDYYYCISGNLDLRETIAVFKAKDGKAGEIEKLLKNKRESLISEANNYNQKNYEMAMNGVVKTVDSTYVYMIISPNVSEIVKVMDKYF